ncbi:hypothetical protein NIES4075_73450 [Tolypothrix sp. NIES-4075]|uniref:hypothetical protein n=1 Tax=Tolypothrix sp. NIES-4075 TaxID=2005459 RepID=UPI000B5C94B5|nr:hypothetical protein [Tolypothrix sp. NIES-4075]GAX46324.1 hypothetical protein NIES4075_73450 [Tolypothrix sp. NIES-4075]
MKLYYLNGLPPDEIAELETESGYRKRCVKLLAKVIGLTERAVRTWGKGLNFEKMPECHKKTLAYALAAVKSDDRQQQARLKTVA